MLSQKRTIEDFSVTFGPNSFREEVTVCFIICNIQQLWLCLAVIQWYS